MIVARFAAPSRGGNAIVPVVLAMVVAACGPAPSPTPSTAPPASATATASGPSAGATISPTTDPVDPSAGPRLKATGNLAEPLPPASFDPASVPAFSYVTEDGRSGVWVGAIGRPDLATALVGTIPEAQGGYDGAVRFADGSVVVRFTPNDRPAQLVLLRPGAEPRVLLERVGSALAADPEAGTLVIPRLAAQDADDGVWQVWLDGREPRRVLPPVGAPELAARTTVALGPEAADGRGIAAAACDGDAQVAWPGGRARRLGVGIPLGFDRGGTLIAHADCANGAPVRVRMGAQQPEPLAPAESGYQAIVTPDRQLLAFVNETAIPGAMVVLDLESGARRQVPLAAGGWEFAPETSARYLVLRRNDGDPATYRFTYAVHDVREDWTGYFVVDTFPPAG